MSFLFLQKQELITLHAQLIENFGGSYGLRDDGALESAITAAENRAYYDKAPLAVCAAAYAFHLCQAHAFLDGNKRIAAAAAELFVELNGASLNATNEQIVELFLRIAASSVTRAEVEHIFASWIMLG